MSKNADESANNALIKHLEEVGLTEKEARVYIALLPYRDVGTSKLIRATGLHGQFVYDALEKLEGFGLAKHVIQNGRKKFTANPPSRILSMIEQKKLSAQSVIHQLSQRFAGAAEQDFEAYQGEDAFMAHQIELLRHVPDGSVIDVISSDNEKYSHTFKASGLWDEYQKIWRNKRIHFRIIVGEKQRARFEQRIKEEPSLEYRILNGLKLGKISIEVRPTNITFAVYSDLLLDLTLTGKDVVESYKEFFESLWNLSAK